MKTFPAALILLVVIVVALAVIQGDPRCPHCGENVPQVAVKQGTLVFGDTWSHLQCAGCEVVYVDAPHLRNDPRRGR